MKHTLLILLLIFSLSSCVIPTIPEDNKPDDVTITPYELGIQPEDTFYQLQVYAFNDSNDDGVGDFKGIADKAEYLYSLGIDAIWLSPIHPSPSYHHYDVVDYFDTDSIYVVDGFGFDEMLAALHQYGIDVILDLVINHSSHLHPYFLEAVDAFKKGENNPYINYYLLSNNYFTHPTLGYGAASVDGIYYDAFYGFSHMPAFNFDYEPVRAMFLDIMRFWLDKGVAGFRLDAAKHVYDDLNKNNELFRYFISEIEKDYPNAYFVNEIWASESEVISYYASNMSNFNFDTRNVIASSIFGNRTYASFLENFQTAIRFQNSDAIEAHFISNHDIGRLPQGFSLRDQKMMASLLILSPGNSYMYYGDEISLTGARILNPGFGGYDDSAYRTPMLWDDWSNIFATYISYHIDAIKEASTTSRYTVEMGLSDPSSLLYYYQKLNAIKSQYPIISTGKLEALSIHSDLISYQVSDDNDILLIIHNLNASNINVTLPDSSALLDYVTDTDAPTLLNNILSISAYSSVVIRLSESLVEEDINTSGDVYLRGTFSSWVDNDTYKMTYANSYYTYDLTVSETSQFKVYANNTWYGYDDLTTTPSSDITREETYGNIIINPGTYTVMFGDGVFKVEKKTS